MECERSSPVRVGRLPCLSVSRRDRRTDHRSLLPQIPDRTYVYPSPSPTPSPTSSPTLRHAPLPSSSSSIAFPLEVDLDLSPPVSVPPSLVASSLPLSLFPVSPSPRFGRENSHSQTPSPSLHRTPSSPFEETSEGRTHAVGYSSLPPSPTRSFISLQSPQSPADTLDVDLLRRRFESPEPNDEGLNKEDGGVREDEKRSLWEHLQEEIWANDFESGQDMKCESFPALLGTADEGLTPRSSLFPQGSACPTSSRCRWQLNSSLGSDGLFASTHSSTSSPSSPSGHFSPSTR